MGARTWMPMPRIKPPWASGQPGCVSGGFDDVTAPGFTEAQPMLIFFWPCFTLLGLSTCSIQSSSRESSRQHKPRSESQQSRGIGGHHWFHGVSLSTQALFKITKVAADRFWTFVSLWFLLRLHSRCHKHSPQKLPASDPQILAAAGRKRSKHRCEVYVQKFHSFDNWILHSFDSFNFCTSSMMKGLKLICVAQTGQ